MLHRAMVRCINPRIDWTRALTSLHLAGLLLVAPRRGHAPHLNHQSSTFPEPLPLRGAGAPATPELYVLPDILTRSDHVQGEFFFWAWKSRQVRSVGLGQFECMNMKIGN